MAPTRVGVVVLGDMGRSPRMQYHVMSLISHGYEVDFIGYKGTALPDTISNSDMVKVVHMRPVPSSITKLPKLIAYIVKSLWQILFLLLALPLFSHLNYILVQTPPGIPTLPTLWMYCTVKGSQLVVDWHNYSHTILSLALPTSHPMVSITKVLERLFGQQATHSFCVTKAMSRDLSSNWGVHARVLYDRPPDIFRPVSVQEKEELFKKLASDYPVFSDVDTNCGVLVSSTSWTEDEDFGVLLKALQSYEEAVKASNESTLCDLIVVITGKGPQKSYYLDRIKELGLKHVQIVTPWLETEDYPRMLASADLGVCLHTSSSGLDLPMKVVDMFGCGLPVAAIEFEALSELVQDGENGRTFKNSEELSTIIQNWFRGFPCSDNSEHRLFRDNLERFRSLRWAENWDLVALNVFKQKKNSDSFLSGLIMMLFFVGLFISLSSFVPMVQ